MVGDSTLTQAFGRCPADRMKAGKDHEVPLSKRALALLDMPREKNGYVFPGAKANAPLGDKALRHMLQAISGNGLTVHGFRSTFRDWAGDRTNFARDVIEHALAHAIKDKTEAAYRRSAALEKRRKLMEAWSGYCATTPGATAEVMVVACAKPQCIASRRFLAALRSEIRTARRSGRGLPQDIRTKDTSLLRA